VASALGVPGSAVPELAGLELVAWALVGLELVAQAWAALEPAVLELEALALELVLEQVLVLARGEAAQARDLVARMSVVGWRSSRVRPARVPNWERPRLVRSGSLCRSRDLASPTGHRYSPSMNRPRSSARRC